MKQFDDLLEVLSKDEQQLEAYLNDDSLVIKAGPGSGKTTLLTMKLAKLIKEKVRFPRKVACITFSNEATNNLERKIDSILDITEKNYFVSTVHSFCLSQVISPFINLVDIGVNKDFKIIANEEKEKIISCIKRELRIDDYKVNMLEMDKERTLLIDGLSEVKVENYELAKKIAIKYESYLIEKNLVDFISIVKHATDMIQNDAYVRKCLEARYPYILIDEYQDLGKPLHEMILCLSKNTNIKIVAVGDPNQSIYGFNGASPKFFLELQNKTTFKVINLVNNYRSEQGIVNASSKLLNLSEKYVSRLSRKGKSEINLIKCKQNFDDQLNYIVDVLVPESLGKGIPLNEIAILLPSRYQIADTKAILSKKEIPFYVSNTGYPRTEFISWLENCAAWLLNERKIFFTDLFNQWISVRGIHFANSKEAIMEKTKLYKVLVNSPINFDLLEWLKYLNHGLKFKKSLSSSNRKEENIESIVKLILFLKDKKTEEISIKEFSNAGLQGNKVSVLTRHSSKGLEFEIVIVPLLEEGSLPFYKNLNNPEKLEEEKRMLFVCISRSKSICYLLMSKTISGYKKELSRFLVDFEFDHVLDL